MLPEATYDDYALRGEAYQAEISANQAVTAFWRERESMNEFLVTAEPSVADEVRSQQREFATATNVASNTNDSANTNGPTCSLRT